MVDAGQLTPGASWPQYVMDSLSPVRGKGGNAAVLPASFSTTGSASSTSATLITYISRPLS